MFSELYLYSLGEKRTNLSSQYFFLQHSLLYFGYCDSIVAIMKLI